VLIPCAVLAPPPLHRSRRPFRVQDVGTNVCRHPGYKTTWRRTAAPTCGHEAVALRLWMYPGPCHCRYVCVCVCVCVPRYETRECALTVPHKRCTARAPTNISAPPKKVQSCVRGVHSWTWARIPHNTLTYAHMNTYPRQWVDQYNNKLYK
jgi:hypothetical protein